MNAIPRIRLTALAAACLFFHMFALAGEGQTRPAKVLCTTFPIYQLTRNIAQGSESVTVDLMIPAAMGCPHDYALTPQDMAKIAASDILVVNGLGMEEFMGKPVERANPDIIVIDSSLGVTDVIEDEDDEDDHHLEEEEEECDPDHEYAEDGHDRHGDEHDDHHHHGPNSHIFSSPALSAGMVETIAGRLCVLDPAGAAIYAANASAYAARLRGLAGEMADAGKGFANNRIVEPHGAFDYLARDLKLEIVAHLQPHGQELSASQMLELLEIIRERKPAVIVVETQYSTKAGETIAAEAGLPAILLDSAASGPDDAPLDYYETVMRDNLLVLKKALGWR
ncbi:MAG: zinc ABC transporter substrate-binding protein [Planctomycetota bacterium]|jgi:zinc/manganese transport system substrate-binding protein/zinc transport system substrate-binding protein|nr:zinc ABC transporter substrate-binding protein [Planctomycetota bacterium]